MATGGGAVLERGVTAGARALCYKILVARRCEEDQRETALRTFTPPHFLKPELVAIEVERLVEIAHA